MIVNQSNGVSAGIYAAPERGEVVLDIYVGEDNRNLSTGDDGKKIYQNVSIEDAKTLRKALKKAIKALEGK